MTKFILAIWLALMTVTAPSLASCGGTFTEAVACCCAPEVDESRSVQLTADCCCSPNDGTPAAPASEITTGGNPAVSVAPGQFTFDRLAETRQQSFIDAQRRPLHLASNKVYLLNRSLLI